MKHRKRHKRSHRRNYSHWIPAYSNPRRSRLGSGIRFRQLSAKLASRRYKTGSRKGQRYTTDPRALAAWIGRKKYGKKRFQKMAATGLRRAVRRAHGHRPRRHAFGYARRAAANPSNKEKASIIAKLKRIKPLPSWTTLVKKYGRDGARAKVFLWEARNNRLLRKLSPRRIGKRHRTRRSRR